MHGRTNIKLPVTSSTPLKHLSGEHFPDDDAVERAACVRFRQQPQEFYAVGLQGPLKRWDKSLNLCGDYVEKLNVVCMPLSPFVSFQSLFVTYLLTFSRNLLRSHARILQNISYHY